jgi:Icc-related predicted phosphoesterase
MLAHDSQLYRRIRVAAIGDLHVRCQDDHRVIPGLENISDHADLLVIAGDLTENGRLPEAEAVGEILKCCRLPIIAVLGNHDLRALRRAAFRQTLERSGIEVLEGRSTTVTLQNAMRVGIAGTTGCGGGFWPQEGPNAIHARTFKRLAVRAKREQAALDQALSELDSDVRIALTHYAPTTSTLGREPIAKYWMLGNCELGTVLDRKAPDLVIHGHAHLGTLCGQTPGGLQVRNVALPVVGAVHVEIIEPTGHAFAPARELAGRCWL